MVTKRGRPKMINPSREAMKKRLYRLRQQKYNSQWERFLLNVINGMKNFLKSPF